MQVVSGGFCPYTSYREFHRRYAEAPMVWAWQEVLERLASSEHHERGSLTLSKTGTASDCELLPGMAISIQVIEPGGRTRPHSHAWWHLFFVQSGTGVAVLGDQNAARSLSRGDVVLVPAWCAHRFENLHQVEELIMMSLTNLPQQTKLSNLLSHEPDEHAEAISAPTA